MMEDQHNCCCICLGEFTSSDDNDRAKNKLFWCDHNNFHTKCVRRWMMQKIDAGGQATCPYCRDEPDTVQYLLFNACAEGDVTRVDQLLSNKDCQRYIDHWTGFTPLHIACRFGHSEIVSMLMMDERYKGDINKVVGDVTPLQLAEQYGHRDTMNAIYKAQVIVKSMTDEEQVIDLTRDC